MPPSTSSYTFARFNLLSPAGADDKRGYILAGLQGPPVYYHGAYWSFLEVEQLSFDGEAFFTGLLVRYRSETEEEVVNQTTRSIETELVENAIDEKSRFFLHPASMVMAFHAIAPQINIGAFRARFEQLFRAAHGDFFVEPEIQIIEEEFAIMDALRNFERISTFRVSLHPSNPHSRDLWMDLDNHLKKLNAAQYKEEYKAAKQSSGLQLAEDEEIRKKLLWLRMATVKLLCREWLMVRLT